MPYCTVCGTELDENGVCPRCAAEADENARNPTVSKVVDTFQNANDVTESYDEDDIRENRIFAVLGYFGLLVFIPIICAPGSKFCRFHASESIDLIIFDIIYATIAVIVTILCFKVGRALGYLIMALFIIIGVFSLIFWFMGIANAAQGHAKEIPLIGRHRMLK